VKTNSRYFLVFVIIFASQISFANSGMVDPVTKKEISYYITYFKTKAYKLNPFEDLEIQFPVIKNNQLCNDKIKTYLTTLTTDEGFRIRFRQHSQQAIANFIRYSKDAQHFSEYDLARIKEQSIVLEAIQCKVLYYYNNLLCIQIKAGYTLNQQFGNLDHRTEMTHCIYINLTTGTISSLIDLCPKKYQAGFINYITHERDKALQTIIAYADFENDEVDTDEEGGLDSANHQRLKTIGESNHYVKEKIDLNDLSFDVNAFNFPVIENGFNTIYARGRAYTIYANEDSIYKYLPWTFNRNKTKFSTRLNPTQVNQNLMIYDRNTPLFYDQYLRNYFETQTDKKKVTIYFRQNFAGDTVFKKIESLVFNSDNTISHVTSDFSDQGNPKEFKRYNYVNGRLEKMDRFRNSKMIESVDYAYNNSGYLQKFKRVADGEPTEEHNYAYEYFSVHECVTKEGSNKCYTYSFDSLGNYVSRYEKGEKPLYVRTFVGNKMMANGETLYSYNVNNNIESVENDRGRYYTRYFYDAQKRICQILKYDGKQIKTKEIVAYDSKGRIIQVTKADFSYGKLQTQVQHKIEYTY
jgi:hypothetical protein